MIDNEEQVRAAIAEQAGEWLVANDDGPLDAQSSAALANWLKSSPVHVEEFLGVSVVARDLRKISADPEFSVEVLVAQTGTEEDNPSVAPFRCRATTATRPVFSRRGPTAAMAAAVFAVFGLGLLWLWSVAPRVQGPTPDVITALHFETRHGEQLNRRLPDDSVLHLDTDSAVTIRYGKAERLAELTFGQAAFEVAHDPGRAFRVLAGSAEIVAVGTRFNVRLQEDSTVITVIEGRVNVGPSPMLSNLDTGSRHKRPPRSIQLSANQQIRVGEGEWLAGPAMVDTQRITAWLRRQIVFDQEPLERVAAEFNRYAPKPIEIMTPALRDLEISGVFATDDTATFIAFLRSLKGVRLEVTTTRIRVSQDPHATAPEYR